jgi:putative membrane protein
MSRILIRWGINTIAIWVAIELVPGIEHTGSALSLILIALVFGLVNALVRPLLTILTCPLIILTLGLFMLVINALMLWLTASLFESLAIDGFLPALLGALIISIVSGAISLLIKEDWEDRRARRPS